MTVGRSVFQKLVQFDRFFEELRLKDKLHIFNSAMLEKWCHFSCNLWRIIFLMWATACSDCGLHHWASHRYTTRTWSRKPPWERVTAILKLSNGWWRVVMCKGLLVSMAWNGHDMSIRDANIGPQCYGHRSDAVVCVYSGQGVRFADIFRFEIWKRALQFGLIFSRYSFRAL